MCIIYKYSCTRKDLLTIIQFHEIKINVINVAY